MPIVWRYLLRSYFQVLTLCVSSFIAILLVLRFQEIARFASSGAPALTVLLFTLFQIPYILPIALPISCLIAAIILFQRLSHTQELTAFRACGLGLKSITAPLIYAGLFLMLINFTISCEIAPRCRALSKEMIYQSAAVNPFLLFQRDSLVKLKNAYIDIKVLKSGKYAEDVVMVIKNSSSERLGVMVAKELSLQGDLLKGKQVAFVSSVDPKKGAGFDHLIIENQAQMDTQAKNLSQFTQNTDWNFTYDYQPLRMILAKESVEKKHKKIPLGKTARLELSKRFSLGIAAFTFTLIGVTFGIQISRNRSKKGIIYAIALASLYLICFIVAKSLRYSLTAAALIYLLPHPLIILLSLRSLKSVTEGVE